MVMVQRAFSSPVVRRGSRRSPSSPATSSQRFAPSFSLSSVPYGGDGNVPPHSAYWASEASGWSPKYQSGSYWNPKSRCPGASSSIWKYLSVKWIFAAALLSWMLALQLTGKTQVLKTTLLSDLKSMRVHQEEVETALGKALDQKKEQDLLTLQLEKTRHALEHEVKVLHELFEADIRIQHPPPSRPENERLISVWLDHRLDALKKKMYYLQDTLRSLSKRAVLETYGPGPHRVRFTVDLPHLQDDSDLSQRTFTVETASLDIMPHSVHFFLDQIKVGLWSNTIFSYDPARADHVVAAAPMDFDTQRFKHAIMGRLQWTGLGWPEYSEQYTHETYTLGFTLDGPTFYINTMDNTKDHGPNSQGHHVLPEDADPCFARVVEGVDVIDAIIQQGRRVQLESIELNGGAMGEQALNRGAWTRIVSAVIV